MISHWCNPRHRTEEGVLNTQVVYMRSLHTCVEVKNSIN